MRTKLLLADDSITIQKVVGIIFAGEEYELTIVNNGDAALAKASEIRPDVLLVDAVMPGKTGYEVCEEIRRDPVLAGTPILLLTGAFEQFDEGKAKQSGADDFISKPFESQHLIDKVTGLVELGEERRAVAPAPAPAAASVEQAAPARPVPAPPPPPAVPPPAAPEFEFEMVEGTTDDDLWGAFELEEVTEGEVTAQEAAADVTGFAPAWETAEATDFAFEEAAEPSPFEIVPEEQFGVIEEDAAQEFEVAPTESEEFFVETLESAPAGLTDLQSFAPPAENVFDLQFAPEEEYAPAPETLAPGVPSSGPVERDFDIQFAPEEEHVPAPEALAAAPVAPAPVSASAAGGAVSDEQLAALVSRISRDIIEKIAWEVVPDLAERIISEEIRKIKEGK